MEEYGRSKVESDKLPKRASRELVSSAVSAPNCELALTVWYKSCKSLAVGIDSVVDAT